MRRVAFFTSIVWCIIAAVLGVLMTDIPLIPQQLTSESPAFAHLAMWFMQSPLALLVLATFAAGAGLPAYGSKPPSKPWLWIHGSASMLAMAVAMGSSLYLMCVGPIRTSSLSWISYTWSDFESSTLFAAILVVPFWIGCIGCLLRATRRSDSVAKRAGAAATLRAVAPRARRP